VLTIQYFPLALLLLLLLLLMLVVLLSLCLAGFVEPPHFDVIVCSFVFLFDVDDSFSEQY